MLNKNQARPSRAARLLPALLLINLALLLHYLVWDYQVAVHSDSAVMNLLAQEIHDTGQFFPRGWHYANGDLWVLGTHAVIVPLLALFPNTYALHAVSGMVTAALVLLGAWGMGAVLGQSRNARLATLTVLAGGLSANMAENLYGQAAYGLLFAQASLLAWSGWRLLHGDGAARRRWGALFALLMLLAFWSNPARAAVSFGLPLMAATAAVYLLPRLHGVAAGGLPLRRCLSLLALLLAALAAGSALHAHYVKLVGNSGLAPALWLGFDGMLRNVLGALRGLMSLFGGLPAEGAPVLKAAGAWAALHLLAALALLFLLPWALARALRVEAGAPAQRGRLFIAVFLGAALLVNLIVLLATTLPDMAAPEASVRYLVPSLTGALVLLIGIAVDDFRWQRPATVLATPVLALLALSAASAYYLERAPRYFARARIIDNSPYHKFAAFMAEHDLRYGYANFWSAGRITLLSGQHTRIRQVTLDNGLPVPSRHLASDRWYEAEAWQGETFLMLTYDEEKQVDWAQMARYLGEPSRKLEFQGTHLICYPFNIAARLPQWDWRRSPPLRFPVGAATPHRIGQLSADGTALEAGPGASGHLQYGPHRVTTAGNYLATFTLETAGDSADFGVVDVVANGGGQLLAGLPIKGRGPLQIEVPFRLDWPAPIEFRVWSNGSGRVVTRGVELRLRDPRAQP